MREARTAAARAFLPTVTEDAIGWIVRRLPSALACRLLSRVRRGRAEPVRVRSRRRAVRTALVMSFATRAAAALLVVVAAFLVLPPQAEAQTVETLVNNLSEAITANTSVGGTSNFRQAQKFTVPTGQNYSLDDVTIRVSTRSNDGLVVSIRDGSAADPPGTALYTLIPPASPGTGNQVYSAPAGAVLEGGNNYFVMLERAQNTGNTTVVSGTDANGQSGETGWSIADDRRERSGGSWSDNTHALKIRIRGSFSTYAAPPTHHEIWSATLTVAEISAGGSTFGYGFLDATSAGSLSQEEFTYYGTEYSILLFYRNTDTDPDLWLGLDPQGATAFDNEELSLVVDGTAFSFGDAVFNSTGQWVWAESGLNWADGDRAAVRLLGPPPPPVALVSATVSGTALTLTYDTGMDQTSVPAASAFTVDVDAATTTVSSVAVAGAEVTLTLASTPASTATVTVDYAVPATNPLRSLPAVIVPTFSDQPVAHIVNLVKNRSQAAAAGRVLVGTSSGVAYASAQQFDTGGNAAGYLLASVDLDVDGVEANTDPRVSIYTKSGSNPGTLVHTLANPSSVADGWRTFTAPPGALLGKDTDYFVVVEHTGTTETFALGLTASDAEDSGKADGWGIANTRRNRTGGTWGAAGNNDSVRIQVQGAIMPNRLATGAPAITGTAAVGQTLAAATDGISDPDGTTKAEAGDTGYAYTYQWIRVDSDGSSNATDISGATASTYVLASADEGKKIKVEVAFTDDADSDEEPLTSAAYPPTGTVAAGAANADPVFMDGASTSRDFNETIGDAAVTTASNIGTAVGATDTDTGDTLEYTLSGTDAAKFGIINTSGQIQTKVGEKYSYETDTSYAVTVTVVDGNGGSDSIDVTLDVADQDEPPLRPVAPGVNGHSTDVTKLLLTLTRPDNTDRPNISGYKVRLHGPGSGWSELDWVTGVNRTIAGANSGVRYTVQYRARNDEGESQWSPSGFGSTRAHATGMPDITGTAAVTQTLTAGTSGISDGNGKSKAENGDVGFAYTYQWVRRVGGTDSNISGATSRTYTLTAADEGNKVKVKASFTDNAGYAEGPLTSNAYPATGTIAPEPDPELSFADINITVDEDAGTATLTVELDPASAGTVTVDFATSDETALAGVDYTATSGTLTFAASETSKTITVPILDGSNYETLRKRFNVTLSNATGATLPAVPDAQVNIRNDDAVPTVSLGDVTVDEGAGVMTLTLALSYLSSEDITYRITHGGVSGTATVTDDYVAFLQGGVQTFTVPAGHMSATFDITIVDDSLDEPDETILIEWDLSISSSAMPAFFDFTGTITDNDTAGVTLSKSTLTVTEEDTTGDSYTVVLDSQPSADVVVTVAGHAGTDVTVNPTTLTFTSTTWNTPQPVTVTAADDADTANDTVSLTHSATSSDANYSGITIPGVTVTVSDNDTGNNAPVFDDGTSQARSFVEGAGDRTEQNSVNIGAPVSASDDDAGDTLTYSPLGGPDAGSFGFNTGNGQIKTRVGQNYDREAKSSYAVTVTVSDGTVSVSADVTLTVTDLAEAPFQPDPPVVTPAASATSLEVSWVAPNNTGRPDIEHYVVRHQKLGQPSTLTNLPFVTGGATSTTIPGRDPATAYQVQVQATNADGPGPWSTFGDGTTRTPDVGASRTALTVTEQDAAGDSYTLVLRSQPSADVVVTVAGHSGTDVTVNPTTLTFTSTTWNTPQPVTVTAADDADTANDTVSLTHSATSSDANYSGITIPGVTVTVSDNDGSNTAPVFDDGARTRRTLSETIGSTPPTSGQPVGQPVAASDADNDSLEYSLEGADAGRFTVAPGTGQIRTLANTVYDYEAQQSYEVVVRVEDGNGGSDTIEVTLAVEDHVETPRQVSQPTVTTQGTTSLRVTWTAPENVGRPAITGYDVRSKAGVDDTPQRVTGTSATLTGLEPDTRYIVDVRAVNADGAGQNWSTPLSGRTAPVLVTFGASSYTATEGGAAATVTVALSEAVGSSTSIPLRPTNRGGATDADYTGVPPNVTFGAAQTSTTFTVTAVDDSDNDRGESVRIGFGVLPSGLAAGSPATATVALDDDDSWVPPTVRFGASSYTAAEGGGAVTVTVEVDRLEVPFTLPLTRDAQGGATSSDYSGVPTSVVFGEFDRVKSFTVTAVDDEVHDDGESLVIGFGSPLPGRLNLRIGSPSQTRVRLVDNDVPEVSGKLRLAQRGGVYGGSYGRLQVYHDGQWGLVCEGNFGREEARVACRQLGFADGEEGYGGTGSGGLPFWLKGVQCVGTESRLVDCGHRGLKEHYCGSFDITGVECSRTPLSMADARVDGPLLTVRYNAALDGGSRPSAGDFVVLAGSAGGASAVPVTSVSVDGDGVALALARPVLPNETLRLSYLDAPMHPLRDLSGTAAAAQTDMAVRNETRAAAAHPVDLANAPAAPREPLFRSTEELSVPIDGRAEAAAPDLSRLLADAGASAPPGRLDLSSRGLGELSMLSRLTELRALNLADNEIVDLAPLAGLTSLRVLDLSSNAVADLGPLAGLTGLRRLDLSGNRIADISALSGLVGLEVLLLDGNRIDDVLPLWSLRGLEHLGLSRNRIAEVGMLSELASLKRLDLSGNAVWDVAPLGDLSELMWLRLHGNPVLDAAPLARLGLLRWLWLDAGAAAHGLLNAWPPATDVPLVTEDSREDDDER